MNDTAVEPVTSELQKSLSDAIERNDDSQVAACVDALPEEDSARVISHLDDEQQVRLLNLLAAEQAATLLTQLPEPHAAQLIQQLPTADAAAILDHVDSNDQADLLGRLDEDQAAAVLNAMSPEEAVDARRLIAYDPETSGGLMITEYLSYAGTDTVDDAVADMRKNSDRYRGYDVQYAYTIDGAGRLDGVLRMRDLLLSPGRMPISELRLKDPLSVHVDDSLENLERFFERHSLFGVPVVDAQGRMCGVVRRQDVEHAAEERASRNLLKFTGIPGGEELRSMPLRQRSLRRLSWLSINVLLNLVAASVIAVHQETLEAAVVLAVFLPIISDMSGCSGNQAVAVSMRELALGLARPQDALRVFRKEAALGFINGIMLGLLIALIAYIWKGNPYLGGVVGIALAANTLVAVCIGGVVPLLLKGLGQDPALASGPILTTITDLSGFLIMLSLASEVLPRLAA